MTLVILQYPALLIFFGLCALLTVLTLRLPRCNHIAGLLAGLAGTAVVVFALICGVPMAEILLLLTALALLACLCAPKEGRK